MAYRLGYQKGQANNLIQHPWCNEYEWDSLVNLTVTPPWVPRLKYAAYACVRACARVRAHARARACAQAHTHARACVPA